MRRSVGILFALARRYVLFHFFLITQIEGDCAIDLLQNERRVMRSDGLRRFANLEFSHEVGKRHTTSYQVQAPMPVFNEFLTHNHSF